MSSPIVNYRSLASACKSCPEDRLVNVIEEIFQRHIQTSNKAHFYGTGFQRDGDAIQELIKREVAVPVIDSMLHYFKLSGQDPRHDWLVTLSKRKQPNPEILRSLLEAGCDPNFNPSKHGLFSGSTPLVVFNRFESCLDVLFDAGASLGFTLSLYPRMSPGMSAPLIAANRRYLARRAAALNEAETSTRKGPRL